MIKRKREKVEIHFIFKPDMQWPLPNLLSESVCVFFPLFSDYALVAVVVVYVEMSNQVSKNSYRLGKLVDRILFRKMSRYDGIVPDRLFPNIIYL